jgi:hypothetical protein
MHTKAVLGVLVLVSCGCGNGSAPAVPLQEVPAQVGQALCEKLYTCCSETERTANPVIGGDVSSCQTTVGLYFGEVVSDLQRSVSGGRTAYHADRMAGCLDQIRAQSCDEVKMGSLGLSLLCNDSFEPKVARGGDCSGSSDCIDGWCDGAAGPALGKCAEKKADGADCVGGDECTAGGCDNLKCAKPKPGGDNLCN